MEKKEKKSVAFVITIARIVHFDCDVCWLDSVFACKLHGTPLNECDANSQNLSPNCIPMHVTGRVNNSIRGLALVGVIMSLASFIIVFNI